MSRTSKTESSKESEETRWEKEWGAVWPCERDHLPPAWHSTTDLAITSTPLITWMEDTDCEFTD